MCEPNTEEIVTYLSTKFNRIFIDREFVCCVSSDFHRLRNKNKCRVLVFPTLGPVYQRALKYQAEAFDFATFELSAGIFKTIAVCQKDHILRKQKEDLRILKERTMSSDSSNSTLDASGRRKRPERQLYVPPAQRRLASNKETDSDTKQNKQSKYSASNGKSQRTAGVFNKIKTRESSCKIVKKISSVPVNENKFIENDIKETCEEISSVELKQNEPLNNIVDNNASDSDFVHISSLVDLMQLDLLSIPSYYEFVKMDSPYSTCGCVCGFHQYLNTRFKNDLKLGISIFYLNSSQQNSALSALDYLKTSLDIHFNNSLTMNQEKLCSKIQLMNSSKRSNILQYDLVGDSSEIDIIFKENCAIGENQLFYCDSELYENIVDLSEFNMGHYFKIGMSERDHIHICQESHDIKNCYMEVKRDLLSRSKKKSDKEKCDRISISKSDSYRSSKTEKKKEPKVIKIPEVIKISEVESTPIKSEIKIETSKKKLDIKKKCQHDEEILIMRKTKENINRKTRPLMKYSDDSDDLLRIDKQDNVNNWEDLFDDDGQIQEELLTEIVHKVGKDMKIVKASEDYTPYMPKSTDELDHVVEIYNFPPSLTTGDIIHAFSMFDSNSMYVQWVDETHALLVLGSSSQAQRACEVNNPFIKVRPMSSASVVATAAASRYDLKPAMKRPETNLQTARRLITSHLGKASRVTKEQSALEREHLRKAREQKKLIRQNERDAWEGNFH